MEVSYSSDTTYLTHNYHPYPCKFVPQIPKQIISKYSKEGDLILDPFCGSGTTLTEASLNMNVVIARLYTTKGPQKSPKKCV